MLQNKLVNLWANAFESITGFSTTIGSDHAYIHDGLAFTALIDTGAISAAYDIAFTTPSVASGKYVHWRPTGITTSANYVAITLREGDVRKLRK